MKVEWAGEIVGIRPYGPGDLPQLFEAVQESMRELHQWMPWCHSQYNIDDANEFLALQETEWSKGEHFSFVIHARANGLLLGGVGLNFINRVHQLRQSRLLGAIQRDRTWNCHQIDTPGRAIWIRTT